MNSEPSDASAMDILEYVSFMHLFVLQIVLIFGFPRSRSQIGNSSIDNLSYCADAAFTVYSS